MMELNPKNARMLSMLGQRGAVFGVALPEIAESRSDLRLLSADLAVQAFQSKHPDKFLSLGIAEQNMLGVAAGLAKEGNCVFAATYAPFLSMRAFEQIRANLGYMKFNIKAVGVNAGMAMGISGCTHFALEDLALMLTIPNLTVLSPADAGEALKMTRAASEMEGPIYLRLTGGQNCPVIHKEEYDFQIGRAEILRQGGQLAFIAAGTMVAECLKAAELLAGQGLEASVVNMSTIKPLDTVTLDRVFAGHQALVSVEEHRVIGGLGGALAEYKSSLKAAPPLRIIGLPDAFPPAGEQAHLLDSLGLTAPHLARAAADFFQEVK